MMAVRRAPKEGYARGEEARRRVVDAALRLFARQGYDRVSTRQIAEEAGVNPPALQYYFDSKEGLYLACAEYVAERVLDAVGPILQRAEQSLADGAPSPVLVDIYCTLVETNLDLIISGEDGLWSRFLALEETGLGPGTAMLILRERVLDRLNETFVLLFAQLTDSSTEALETRLRVMAINGQFQVFHMRCEGLPAILGAETVTPEDVRRLKSIVGGQTRSLLESLATR